MKKLDDRALHHVADYFRALSEPLRLKMLNALREREHNVGELTDLCECSQANVSKHLGNLFDAGIVSKRKEGLNVFYRVSDETIFELCETVCQKLESQFSEKSKLISRGK